MMTMKHLFLLGLSALCTTVSACQSSQPAGAVGSEPSGRTMVAAVAKEGGASLPDADPAQETVASDAATPLSSLAVPQVPSNFMSYASQAIAGGKLCVVGAVTDDDGLNEKPIAYVTDARSKEIIWLDQLPLPPDTYQTRATHCTGMGTALVVLLQSDTQSQQTLSQTLLQVVRLNAATGSVQMQQALDVPGAYTAWVDEGAGHFQWMGSELMVSAAYRRNSTDDQQFSIILRLNSDLTPAIGGKQ
jgi:hypothetical protein